MSDSIKKAAKAGALYTVGNVLFKGITFLTLPIFTRLLTTEEFGLFTVYTSYETIVTIFVGLCLFGSLRTGKYDYRQRFDEYVSKTIFLSTIVFAIGIVLANILFPVYSTFFEFNRVILNILLFHSYSMFILQFYNTRLALDYRYREYLLAAGINTVGGTIVSIVLILSVFKSNPHIGRIYGYAVAPICVGFYIWGSFVIRAIKDRFPLVDSEMWLYALRISLPLVIHTFSQQILNQFDRIMIEKMISAGAAGIYGFVHTISNILHIIVMSMDSAWSAWMYEQLNEKQYEQIRERSSAYGLLMSILYVGFISLAPDIMRLVGTADYHTGIRMIVPLAFSVYFVFLYSLPVHVEYFYKKTKYIAMGTSGAAVINFILNYIGIRSFGYQAAAWTTLVSYVILFVFHYLIARMIDRTPMFPVKRILISVVVLAVYSAVVLLFLNLMLFRWGLMVLTLALLLFLNAQYAEQMIDFIPGGRKLLGRFKK